MSDPDPLVHEGVVDVVVPSVLAEERLDRVVAMAAGCSRREADGLIRDGRVRVDGSVETSRSRRLPEGAALAIRRDKVDDTLRPDASVEVDVVYADTDLVVVNKPAGLVVHPGAGNDSGTLAQGLLARFPELPGVGDPSRPGIVHRLDRGTSGLLCVARTPEAYEALVEMLSRHQVERGYLAVVEGVPAHMRGTIDAPIGRSRRDPTRMAVVHSGRPARTHYEVAAAAADASVAVLACRLETGRTHQIRVHLASIGHPVVNDPRYARPRRPAALERPLLHAARLALRHPRTGVEMSWTVPVPTEVLDSAAERGVPAEWLVWPQAVEPPPASG